MRPAELVHAVRAIASGDTLLSPAITRRLLEEFVRPPPPGERPAALRELTERESEVLGLVAQGLSNAEIAQRLFLGETTVKTHVTRVLSKLGLRDRFQAVVLAYESGLVRPGDDALLAGNGQLAGSGSGLPFSRKEEILGTRFAEAHNSEIAGRLGMTDTTVRNHVSAILMKLQVTDRTAAAIKARDAR